VGLPPPGGRARAPHGGAAPPRRLRRPPPPPVHRPDRAAASAPLAFWMSPRSRPGCAPPLPVIHDKDDPETRHADSKRIATSWPGARLVTATGLGRRRIPRPAEVIAEAAAFIGGPRAPAQPRAPRRGGAGGAAGCPRPRRAARMPG